LRQEIAAGLHDSVGQNLAALKISLGLLSKSLELADNPANLEVGSTIDEIGNLIDEIISTTWSLTFELCPPGLHEMGIVVALEWLVKQLASRHDVDFKLRNDGLPKPLARNVRGLVFQMIRELLLNATKHSQADFIEVRLNRQNELLQVVVEDNGCGFDILAESDSISQSSGFGLFSIRERLSYFSGSMEIDSVVGKGTCVTIKFPLETKKAKEMENDDG